MDQRPEGLGREPLDRNPGFDPATDAFGPDAVTAPALASEAQMDEIEVSRVEIERTRADMSETVDAIQDRLSPQNLKDQAKDKVKEATVGKAQEAGSGIVDTIKANPLPAALTGIGIGWLLASARQQNPTQPRYPAGDYRITNEHAPVAREYPLNEGYEGDNGSSAGEALGHARDKASDLAGRAQDGAGDLGSRTREKAGQLGGQARRQAGRAGGGFQRMLDENPLAVGAVAVGAGAAIGLAIPETSKEHEVMGEARDTVVEKGKEKAQETQQKIQRVAEEAQGAAQQEAENQNLK